MRCWAAAGLPWAPVRGRGAQDPMDACGISARWQALHGVRSNLFDSDHDRCRDMFVKFLCCRIKFERSLLGTSLSRCRWKLSGKEGHACGLDHSNDKIHQLFSSVAPAPPLECSIQVALPRCDLQFQYAITSHKASSYACRGEVGNMSPAPPQAPQALQFRGRLCSYDLIQWEKVSIWKHSGENQSLALEACELKGSHDAPLSCGEIPHGEHLPHGCLHLQEPAVFTLQHSDFSYSMKLFESGMSIVRHSLKFKTTAMPCL